MRSICTIDFANNNRNGVTTSADGSNELILTIIPAPTQLTNYIVEITSVSGDVINLTPSNISFVSIPSDYWNGSGTIKFRLLSNESNSDYVTITCVEFESSDNVKCVYINSVFAIQKSGSSSPSTGDYELPIASSTELGGIKVGSNLTIDADGTLNAQLSGSGIIAPINGFFTMAVDEEGNLWAYSADNGTTPTFEYDSATGDLYVVLEVE